MIATILKIFPRAGKIHLTVDTEDESGRRWQNAKNNLFQYEREGEREGNEEGDEEDVGEEGKIKRVLIFTTNTL